MKKQEVSTNDFTSCPEWGKGGHFIVNPETGLRERVQPAEGQEQSENDALSSDSKKRDKKGA